MRLMLLLCLCQGLLSAQGEWHRGVGRAAGSDIEEIRTRALNNARADAIGKAGITVHAGDASLVAETGNELTDFYAKFAESSARGIILEERLVREGELHRVEGTIYQMEIEIDANVVVPQGEPDASFEVSLKSSRQVVKEGEPFTLSVTSSKAGFLTIFNVYRDSLSVVFPNAVDRKNAIRANDPVRFPAHDAYELALSLPAGKSVSSEMFIAVVTEEDIPFPNLTELSVSEGAMRLKMVQLGTYARWLYKIPVARRAADQVPVTVQ